MRISTLGTSVFTVAVAAMASAQTVEPMTAGVVPVVSRTAGARGSQWSTNVYLTQVAGGSPAQVTLTIHAPTGDSWSGQVVVPAAGGTGEIIDVVTALGVESDGNYVMTWWSTQPVVLSTRTFTSEASGSYGQGIASLAEGSGLLPGGKVIFPAPMSGGTHRVNVGVANAGPATQWIHFEAVDANGETVSSWNRRVDAFDVDQLRANRGMSGAGSVTIRCDSGCDGNAYAYASVVVNVSNDAYFLYAGADAGATRYAPAMTTRDDEGVWYITGGSPYDVFEAMGYAVATDRLWQLELFRRQGRGTLAEVFGSGFIDSDILARITGYSEEELQQGFDRMDTDSKAVAQGYVDGVNRRIAEVAADPSLLPYEFQAYGLTPDPWTATDVLAWEVAVQRRFDSDALQTGQPDNVALLQQLAAAYPDDHEAMFSDLRWRNDPSAQTMIPATGKGHGVETRSRPPPAAGEFPDMVAAASRLRALFKGSDRPLEAINARVGIGSYAWVVAGDRTASGNPILYSGPQMGFSTPSIVLEGSIRGGGLAVSGMVVAGLPGIVIGRTPHHAWSMQRGHAHTTDFFLEDPGNVELHRTERIEVSGDTPGVVISVYRSPHGPIVEPVPYDPKDPPETILAWGYAHWGHELEFGTFLLEAARARSVDQFAAALDHATVSQHVCYVDRDGNIAYWMSGRDPVRPEGVDRRFPLRGDGSEEWSGSLRPLPHDRNPAQGWYGGWNNKASTESDSSPQNQWHQFGPAHRAHVIDAFLSGHDDLTFEQVRDLAIDIAATESFAFGGNMWAFVADSFTAAVQSDPSVQRTAALDLLAQWDGHFVAGGPEGWVDGDLRADAWVLQDAWLREVIQLVFEDEFAIAGLEFRDQPRPLLFDVLLHALDGAQASVVNRYDWFRNRSGSGLPTDADGLIVLALDNVLAELGSPPYNRERGSIRYVHDSLGQVHTTPFARRSTYAQVVELGPEGPHRVESMFPLGQSGTILTDASGSPVFDENYLSMTEAFDSFSPRAFPLFDQPEP
jgi:penicillin amidase